MKKEVWDSLLDADMNVRYWTHLGTRYYNRDKYIKIFLAVMSSGAVASWGFWEQVDILWKILSGVSALIAIAVPILGWSSMIEKMARLKQQWTQIRSEYELLWLDVRQREDQNNILEGYKKTKMSESEVSVHETNLPKDKKLLIECWEEVVASRGLSQK